MGINIIWLKIKNLLVLNFCFIEHAHLFIQIGQRFIDLNLSRTDPFNQE